MHHRCYPVDHNVFTLDSSARKLLGDDDMFGISADSLLELGAA